MTRDIVTMHVLRIGGANGQAACGKERVSWVYDYTLSNCIDCLRATAARIEADHEVIEMQLRRRLEHLAECVIQAPKPATLAGQHEQAMIQLIRKVVDEIDAEKETVSCTVDFYALTQDQLRPWAHANGLTHLYVTDIGLLRKVMMLLQSDGQIKTPYYKKGENL